MTSGGGSLPGEACRDALSPSTPGGGPQGPALTPIPRPAWDLVTRLLTHRGYHVREGSVHGPHIYAHEYAAVDVSLVKCIDDGLVEVVAGGELILTEKCHGILDAWHARRTA